MSILFHFVEHNLSVFLKQMYTASILLGEEMGTAK